VAYGQPSPRLPSIAGYVAAVLLALAGIVAGVALIVSGIRSYIDKVEGFERFPVPDSQDVTLGDDGGYSIYFERPGLDTEDPLPAISVTVTAPDGSPVELNRYESDVSYSVSGHDGRGVFTFQADEPGPYRVRADGSNGEVAVGRGIGARFAGAVVAGVGTLLLAPVLGAILALVTFLRRSKAKRSAAASWQQPQQQAQYGGQYGGPPTGWR
jgi:hypothetical protein